MTTLREARDKGKLDQFIKEREAEKGDPKAFNRTVQSMAGKQKHEPGKKHE